MNEERKMNRGKNSLHDFFHFDLHRTIFTYEKDWINARLPVGGLYYPCRTTLHGCSLLENAGRTFS